MSGPIKLVVPFPPGGGNDTIARALGDRLAARLDQPVVIDNQPGDIGNVGTLAVVNSPADGHTVLIASTTLTTSFAMSRKPAYHPLRDLQPIGVIGAGPLAIAVWQGLGVSSVRELVDLARANPNSIRYGSGGAGAMSHLGLELFASAASVELTHVECDGFGPALKDLLAGRLQLLLPSLALAMPFRKAGDMRVLAVTSAERSPLAPELPTASEAGVPGFQLEIWWGLLAPAGLPRPVLERLNAALNGVLEQSEVGELLAQHGAVPRPGTPDDFADLMRFEVARWTRLVRADRLER